jgi:AAA family ATP:ADP antiporter
MYYYLRTTPAHLLKSYADSDKPHEHKAGFFEGIRLLFTKSYLGALFALIIIFEVILSILDIHFQRSVFLHTSDEVSAAAYFAHYGVWIGLVALTSLILGVSNLQRLLGMRLSLLLVPTLLLVSIVGIFMFPTSLLFAFWALVGVRGINYAFNQPTIKQLYIPTSKEAKYKSQAWIEMFGGPIGKTSGSLFNAMRAFFMSWYGIEMGAYNFMTMALMLSGGLGICWIGAIFFIAKKYRAAIRRNEVVC